MAPNIHENASYSTPPKVMVHFHHNCKQMLYLNPDLTDKFDKYQVQRKDFQERDLQKRIVTALPQFACPVDKPKIRKECIIRSSSCSYMEKHIPRVSTGWLWYIIRWLSYRFRHSWFRSNIVLEFWNRNAEKSKIGNLNHASGQSIAYFLIMEDKD